MSRLAAPDRLPLCLALSLLLHGGALLCLRPPVVPGMPAANLRLTVQPAVAAAASPSRPPPRAPHAAGVPAMPPVPAVSRDSTPAPEAAPDPLPVAATDPATPASDSPVPPAAGFGIDRYYTAPELDELALPLDEIAVETEEGDGRQQLQLAVYINEDGGVDRVEVVSGEADSELAQSASQSFATARFLPAKLRGQPVKSIKLIELQS